MKLLKTYLEFLKTHKNELTNIKLIMLLIINVWLFIIFFKILLLNDVNLINNNQILLKASNLIQPVLNILGLDVLTPNMLKMCVISGIIVVSNLAILYFNQMIGLISLGILGRYSYKSYTNYLINSENISYMGFEDKNKVIIPVVKEKVSDSARIVIENTTAAVEHTYWVTWLILGTGLLICFGLLIYSHNNLTDGLINTNQNLRNVNNTLDMKMTRVLDQVNLNSKSISEQFQNLNDTTRLLDKKINQSNTVIQELGVKLIDVDKLANKNILLMSQEQVKLSHKAAEVINEASQASTVVEGVTLGLAKMMDLYSDMESRLSINETKIESIVGTQTPRGSMYSRYIPNIVKKDE